MHIKENIVVICIGTALISLTLLYYPHTLEDAQITFRYALRLSEGYPYGMWNRVGTPVEGSTTILWTLALSLFGPDLNIMAHAAKAIGVGSYFGTILFFIIATKALSRSPNQALHLNRKHLSSALKSTAITISICAPFAWYSSSGMETSLYILLVTLVILLPSITTSLALLLLTNALIVICRPDGYIFSIASSAFYFATYRPESVTPNILQSPI